MELLVLVAGILIGAAAASLVALAWATSQFGWLGAQCSQQIAYWRDEAEQAAAVTARLCEQRADISAPYARTPGTRLMHRSRAAKRRSSADDALHVGSCRFLEQCAQREEVVGGADANPASRE